MPLMKFVAAMEDSLFIYSREYDNEDLIVCVDEKRGGSSRCSTPRWKLASISLRDECSGVECFL